MGNRKAELKKIRRELKKSGNLHFIYGGLSKDGRLCFVDRVREHGEYAMKPLNPSETEKDYQDTLRNLFQQGWKELFVVHRNYGGAKCNH